MLTHFDLFTGIGGFALAAKKAGFVTVGFSEIDNFCNKVLEKNFPDIKNYGDVKELSIEHVDLLTGGFPCQPFSQAGNKRGIEDERYLWKQFRRVITASKPSWIIAENVTGIINMELDNILSDLEIEGYTPKVFVLPACASNAPHRRDRVWVIAHLNSIGSNVRLCHWQAGYLQENQERNVAQIQQEWAQFIPNSWSTYKAGDWLKYNTRVSRRDNGIPSKMDRNRIKALGNAIVPQIIYPVMRYIYNYEISQS